MISFDDVVECFVDIRLSSQTQHCICTAEKSTLRQQKRIKMFPFNFEYFDWFEYNLAPIKTTCKQHIVSTVFLHTQKHKFIQRRKTVHNLSLLLIAKTTLFIHNISSVYNLRILCLV